VDSTPASVVLPYAIVTPVRNEAENLQRLAETLETQTRLPTAWVIVDTGSTDETLRLARDLSSRHSWVSVRELQLGAEPMRGGPIVKAFHAGVASIPPECEVVVKIDADVSMEPDYFERLVAEFERDERLGIAGGICYEREADGRWRQRHGTGPGVWGASRAYRRNCLSAIWPLEERMGWDTVDLVAATVSGWTVRGLIDLPFLHHRSEGERDASRLSHWMKHGRAAHFMGYRPSYLLVRTAFRSIRDPWAVGIVFGYLSATLERSPRCGNESVRAHIRAQQRLTRLPLRAREALRARSTLDDRSPPSSLG